MSERTLVPTEDGPVTEVATNHEAEFPESHIVIGRVAGDLYQHREVLLNGFDIIIDGVPLEHTVDFYAVGRELTKESIIYIGTNDDETPSFFECRDDKTDEVYSKIISIPATAEAVGLSEDEERDLAEHLSGLGHNRLAVLVTNDGLYNYGDMQRLSMLYGFLGSFRGTSKAEKNSPKRRYMKSVKLVECQIDPITKAVSGRSPDNHIAAPDYWPSLDDEPVDGIDYGPQKEIKTSANGYAIVRVAAAANTDIMGPTSSYQMGALDQYFLDTAATLVFSGRNGFTCSQMLSAMGYTNPYSNGMAQTRQQALKACMKAAYTPIYIDTTKSGRRSADGKYRVTKSAIATRIANWDIDVQRLESEDGEIIQDFEVRFTGTPEEVMPIAAISRDWEMITRIPAADEKFKGMRLYMPERLAWRYILKQVHSRKVSNIIKFDTMFREIELDSLDGYSGDVSDEAIRKRRARLIAKLQKMLDQKCKKGPGRMFESWSCTKNRKTGECDGFKIVTLEKYDAKPKLPAAKKRKKTSS